MSSAPKTIKAVLSIIFIFLIQSKSCSGAVLDQILAVVDDHFVTQSDLAIQSAFSLEFDLLDKNGDDRHLQFAIDQILFLEDADKFATDKPTEQEIDEFLNKIEMSAGSSENLNHVIANLGITMDDLKNRVNRFLLSKKFIEQRINYFIFISDNEIDSYYNDHQSEWNGTPIESVRNTIYSIMFEQKRRTKLEDYLSKRRSKASIRITPPYSIVPH
jgi:hypothetical protein